MDLKELKIALDWAEKNYKNKSLNTEALNLYNKATKVFDEECKNYILKLNTTLEKSVIKDTIKDYLDFATPIYWGENQYTEYEEILDLYLEKLEIDELYNFYCKSVLSELSEFDKYSFDTQPMSKNMFIEKMRFIENFKTEWIEKWKLK